jgi:nucleotide-binding universal stress UspA family protein
MISPRIEHVGAAITMTALSDALLAEASRFAERVGAPLTLIHTGSSESECKAYLEQSASRLAIAHQAGIVWNQSEPAQALVSAAERAGIDLLIVGAFEGPSLGRRRFLGPVPRQLADQAHCSLLLVAHPRVDAHRFRRIVVITDFSPCSRLACEQAFWLGQVDAAECVYVISIHTPFMKARAQTGAREEKPARTREEEERLMRDFLASFPAVNVPIDSRIIESTTGFAACELADAVEADLLVLPGQHRPEGRVPPMADWALQVVPCSLWIVHGGAAWDDAPEPNAAVKPAPRPDEFS